MRVRLTRAAAAAPSVDDVRALTVDAAWAQHPMLKGAHDARSDGVVTTDGEWGEGAAAFLLAHRGQFAACARIAEGTVCVVRGVDGDAVRVDAGGRVADVNAAD
eukprot:gene8058-61897_t